MIWFRRLVVCIFGILGLSSFTVDAETVEEESRKDMTVAEFFGTYSSRRPNEVHFGSLISEFSWKEKVQTAQVFTKILEESKKPNTESDPVFYTQALSEREERILSQGIFKQKILRSFPQKHRENLSFFPTFFMMIRRETRWEAMIISELKNYIEQRNNHTHFFSFVGEYSKDEKIKTARQLIEKLNQRMTQNIELQPLTPKEKAVLRQGELGKHFRRGVLRAAKSCDGFDGFAFLSKIEPLPQKAEPCKVM